MLDGYSSLSRATFVPSCLKMFGSNGPVEAMALFFSQEGRLRESPTHKRLRGRKNNCLLFSCYLKTLSYILCSFFSFICLPEQGGLRKALKKNYGIIWEFFPNVGPPHPPFWEFRPFFTVILWSSWKFLGDFKVF